MKLRALFAFAVLTVAGCSSSTSGSSGASSGAGTTTTTATATATSTGASTGTAGTTSTSSSTGSTSGSASTSTTGSTAGSTSSTSTGSTSTGGSSGSTSPYTFWADVAPILEQNCVTCHRSGAIAPFSLRTYQDAVDNAQQLPIAVNSAQAIAAGLEAMPPWPPDSSCNTYEHTRSLTDTQKNIITTWATGGMPEGTPPPSGQIDVPDAGPALAHVDATLSMPGDYLPQLSPDDYHCFIVPWTESTTKYVTGLTVTPGNPKIVHHVIAYVASPADASKYTSLDTSDGGTAGYTCFGGAGADDSAGWLGTWAPGAVGGEFPAGTGIRVDPGSVMILQVHYNVLNGPGQTDLTSVDLELADSVQKEAAVLPDLDPQWYSGNMPIPAGQADVVHSFTLDPTPFMRLRHHRHPR